MAGGSGSWRNKLVSTQHHLLATIQHDMLVYTRHNKLVTTQIIEISQCPNRTKNWRNRSRFPVAGAEPDAPGAAAPQWLPAESDEGLADVLQPKRANGRQHAMVCVILGILRKLLPGPV